VVFDLRRLLRGALLTAKQIVRMPSRLEELQREVQLLNRQINLPPASAWQGRLTHPGSGAGEAIFNHSQLCREKDFLQPYFGYWTNRAELGWRFHRKVWEFVYICQALHERGVVEPGMRGIGFGVGGEPLPALFASQGCEILATDQPQRAAIASGWMAREQHAADKRSLSRPSICPQGSFDARVEFEACDMNAVPAAFEGFDFCWSACALEHLGSIDKGLAFIERSIGCLKPGGFAVHTTEFNLDSDRFTIESGPTVLFRRSDIEALSERLARNGHIMAPLDLDRGDGVLDKYVDFRPISKSPASSWPLRAIKRPLWASWSNANPRNHGAD